MAVFRIDKTRDYTVMANHHLRNKELSLKAKGLLSLMLSLPDDWDYTTKGLARICKDGVDCICSTVRELEQAGYIQRRRVRDGHGRLGEIEYTILERPMEQDESETVEEQAPKRENPVLDYPVQANPVQAFPVLGFPEQDEPEQEKPVEQLNTKKSITKKQNTQSPNTQSFPPSQPHDARSSDVPTDGRTVREGIRERIEYEVLTETADRAQVDELVEIMVEVAMNHKPTIKVGREGEFSTSYVQERFERIGREHICKVLDGIRENTNRVYNTKAYLLSALFNSVATMDNHYVMLVNHDLYGNDEKHS